MDSFSSLENNVTKFDKNVTKLDCPDNFVTKLKRGRKKKYGEPTVIMRVPLSQINFVTKLLDCENCVTKLQNKNVTKLLEDWKQKISGREQLPRWRNVYKLLEELEKSL